MGRAPCCDKTKVKRGPWSPDEDAILKNYVEKHGTGGNWIAFPHKAGLKRCGKSCRLRWLNYLRPDIRHGGFTEEEDHIILTLYRKIGSRWSVIASHLPGRTDNDIKNYWNTKLKKKLLPAPTSSTTTTTSAAATNISYNNYSRNSNFPVNVGVDSYMFSYSDHYNHSSMGLMNSNNIQEQVPRLIEVVPEDHELGYCSVIENSQSETVSSLAPSFPLLVENKSSKLGEGDAFLMEELLNDEYGGLISPTFLSAFGFLDPDVENMKTNLSTHDHELNYIYNSPFDSTRVFTV